MKLDKIMGASLFITVPFISAFSASAEPLKFGSSSLLLSQSESNVTRSGTFVSGEHETKGTVRIIRENDKPYLELGEDFETFDMGPDLVVILHRLEDVIGSTQPPAYAIEEGDYVILAPLKEFSGSQRYEIPDNINLGSYASAAIWCRKFNATFGAATLSNP